MLPCRTWANGRETKKHKKQQGTRVGQWLRALLLGAWTRFEQIWCVFSGMQEGPRRIRPGARGEQAGDMAEQEGQCEVTELAVVEQDRKQKAAAAPTR
jgi:hypothetical protein